jgi:hypothetical protein
VKFGGLDDTVWEQSPETVPRPTRRRAPRRRTLWLLPVCVLVLISVVVVTWQASRSSHPGGDPNGSILRELEPDLAAVPPGATDVVTHGLDAVWSGKCPDNPSGKGGWSEVVADASFTTALPKEQVITSVNTVLAKNGWTRHDESFGPGQGPVARWTKRLAAGPLAQAAVYPVPAGSRQWFLTATAKPPGFALPGC